MRSGPWSHSRDAIWSKAVDTLYGDTLQFLYHLALALLVGGVAIVTALSTGL